MTPAQDAAFRRAIDVLDQASWFLALSEEDKCEAYLLTHMMAVHCNPEPKPAQPKPDNQ